MLYCSTKQALDVWTDLMLAYYGDHSRGSTVASVYLYRLQPHWNRGESWAEPEKRAREANTSLYHLCSLFEDHMNCQIEVGGEPLGEWLKESENNHSWDVRVIRDDEEGG